MGDCPGLLPEQGLYAGNIMSSSEKKKPRAIDILALEMMDILRQLTRSILLYLYLNPLEDRNVEDDELKYNNIKNKLDELAVMVQEMKLALDGE